MKENPAQYVRSNLKPLFKNKITWNIIQPPSSDWVSHIRTVLPPFTVTSWRRDSGFLTSQTLSCPGSKCMTIRFQFFLKTLTGIQNNVQKVYGITNVQLWAQEPLHSHLYKWHQHWTFFLNYNQPLCWQQLTLPHHCSWIWHPSTKISRYLSPMGV